MSAGSSTSFLFEFHDAIATLPGSTPARLLVVSKALEYLDSLAAEAAGIASCRRSLPPPTIGSVTCRGPRRGEPRRHRRCDQELPKGGSHSPRARRRRTGFTAGTGRDDDQHDANRIADFARGAVQDAVAKFRDALAIREEAYKAGVPSQSAARAALAETTARLCTTLIAVGDVPGAIANCRRNLALTDELLRERPDDRAFVVMHAVNATGLGNALRLNRQPDEAAASLDDAISQHQALLSKNPLDAEVRRRLAVSYTYLANVHLDRNEPDKAIAAYERAIAELDALAKADPANARIRTELSYMLNQRVRILMANGRRDEARRDAQHALALLRAGTEQPGAGGEAFNEYTWALVSTEVEDLRNPGLALEYATRAIGRAGSPNPVYLHTLGWAHHRLGHHAEAVATLEQALKTLPPATAGPAVGLRRQIEKDLATFKSVR